MSTLNVLIIEDDTWLAEQYSRVITKAGYNAIITPHTLSAIHVIDEVEISAIILDLLLTGSNAFTLIHELQSYGDTGDIPIILCTNLANDISLEDLKPYGIKRLLDKSKMIPGDLVVALKSVLG